MNAKYLSGDRKYKIAFYGMLAAIAGIALFILFGYFVMFLWNVTIADMFSLTAITFWQALGLFILAKTLFGFGGGSSPNASWRKHSRRRHKKRKRAAEDQDESSEFDDESFQRYWQAEGKAAYDTYRRKDGKDGAED